MLYLKGQSLLKKQNLSNEKFKNNFSFMSVKIKSLPE